MEHQEPKALFLGLSDLALDDAPIDLGGGVTLRPTAARLRTSPFFYSGKSLNDDAKVLHGLNLDLRDVDIKAELQVPPTPSGELSVQYEIGRFIVFLIRLWVEPRVTVPLLATSSMESVRKAKDEDRFIRPLEVWPRFFHVELEGARSTSEEMSWIRENWRSALKLYQDHTEFRLAADAIDNSAFISNTALILISLWGALEALFSPSTSELRFRVSSLIAAYLEPPGDARHERQREVSGLYDKRSAAAHGRPKHQVDDLVDTYALLRTVLLRMIEKKHVPQKRELEGILFGSTGGDGGPNREPYEEEGPSA